MKLLASIPYLAALYASTASADAVSHCPSGATDVCYQIGIPEASASSGSGNIYFQLRGPTSYSWIALATGSRMSNANMFIMYTDGNGNVTISPRQASGQSMPTVANNGANLELLAGSGVSDGVMTANVRCSNCESWKSQTLDLTGSSTWIAAWSSGDPIDSSREDAPIEQHDRTPGTFNVDLSRASVSEDSNPFTGDNASASPTPSSTGGRDGDDAVSENDDDNSSATIIMAHGVIMTIVFVALYPLGAILMPLLGKWMIHAGWQIVALLLMWAAFGLGYVYARNNGELFNQTHTILGTAVVALISLQPFTGLVHHAHYRKHKARNTVSHVHIWYGRAVMIIGIVNGGLGLQLASSSMGWIVAYSVVAGVMTLAYIGALVLKKVRRNGQSDSDDTSSGSPRGPYKETSARS